VLRLSAVVITHNEAAHIADCLASLAFVDEIVVVDDASSDATVEIARRFTPHIVVHPHEGENWDLNKNIGLAAATGDWVLLVDADERVPTALATALLAFLKTTPVHAAYWLPRREIYFGFHAAHAAGGARVLRLVKSGVASFVGNHLHEQPVINGTLGAIEAPLDHLAYESVSHYVEKTNRYTDHEATVRFARGDRAGWREITLEPLKVFRHRYLQRGGYKDGMPGLVFCLATSLYPLFQNLKLWELEQRSRAAPRE
jgi:glycosyltransferase involved in cell wall biosynthesis